MVTSASPIFATSDIAATLKFYKEVLAFDSVWTWGEPPTFGGASKGPVSFLFNLQPDLAQKVAGHEHWINVKDLDELYAVHLRRGAKIVCEIGDRPWGFREYVVEDPSGYHLRFAGPLLGKVPTSEPLPAGVTLERRLPSAEEYEAIAGSAFYRTGTDSEFLDHSWNGVVAVSSAGAAIGMARIVKDAPGWFSVWDVAVLPAWQGKHIGQQMMATVLAMVAEISPGANVFLFTNKHGFYERLGFGVEDVSMRKA